MGLGRHLPATQTRLKARPVQLPPDHPDVGGGQTVRGRRQRPAVGVLRAHRLHLRRARRFPPEARHTRPGVPAEGGPSVAKGAQSPHVRNVHRREEGLRHRVARGCLRAHLRLGGPREALATATNHARRSVPQGPPPTGTHRPLPRGAGRGAGRRRVSMGVLELHRGPGPGAQGGRARNLHRGEARLPADVRRRRRDAGQLGGGPHGDEQGGDGIRPPPPIPV